MACENNNKSLVSSPGIPASDGCGWSQGCDGCEGCTPTALCFTFTSDEVDENFPLCCCKQVSQIIYGTCGKFAFTFECGDSTIIVDFSIEKIDESAADECEFASACGWTWLYDTGLGAYRWYFVWEGTHTPEEWCQLNADCPHICPEPDRDGAFDGEALYTRCSDDIPENPTYDQCYVVVNARVTNCYGETDTVHSKEIHEGGEGFEGSTTLSVGQFSGTLSWAALPSVPNPKYKKNCAPCRDPLGPLLEGETFPPNHCTCLPLNVCAKISLNDACGERILPGLLTYDPDTLDYPEIEIYDPHQDETYTVSILLCGERDTSCDYNSPPGEYDTDDLSDSCVYQLIIKSDKGLCFSDVKTLGNGGENSRACKFDHNGTLDGSRTYTIGNSCGECVHDDLTCPGACPNLQPVGLPSCNPKTVTATIIAPDCPDLDGISWTMYESITGSACQATVESDIPGDSCQVYTGGFTIPGCEGGDPIEVCAGFYFDPYECTDDNYINLNRYRLWLQYVATCLGDAEPIQIVEPTGNTNNCDPVQIDFQAAPPVGVANLTVPYPCICCDEEPILIRITQ